jgi:cell division protein FtsB
MVGVTLLIEILILSSIISTTFGMNKKITKLRQDLVQIEREWPNRDNFSKQKEALKQEISEMHTKFILPQTESTLYSFLSSESKNFNVQVKVLKPAPLQDYLTTKLGKFKYLPIIINARSSFHGLANFMDHIQNSKYFFDITELRIASGYPYHTIDMVICGLVKEN